MLILSFHLSPGLANGLFPRGLLQVLRISFLLHACYISSQFHPSLNDQDNITRRRITMLRLHEKKHQIQISARLSLLLNPPLMNHSILLATETLPSLYTGLQVNNWIDSTINLTIAELWIHHFLSFRIKARTPMQGRQKAEERNFESHNRITLSEVISLNLTICRNTGKNGRRERDTQREEGDKWGGSTCWARQIKKKRRHIQWDE